VPAHQFSKHEPFLKAFKLCTIETRGLSFNLSYESLTSREARAALANLQETDIDRYLRVSTRQAVDDLSTVDDASQEESAYDESRDTGGPDPSNTSIASVIAEVLNAQKAGKSMLQGSGDEGSRTTHEEATDVTTEPELINLQTELDSSRSRAGHTRKPNARYSGVMWWNHQGDSDEEQNAEDQNDAVYMPRNSGAG
jgi:hypothetical protein